MSTPILLNQLREPRFIKSICLKAKSLVPNIQSQSCNRNSSFKTKEFLPSSFKYFRYYIFFPSQFYSFQPDFYQKIYRIGYKDPGLCLNQSNQGKPGGTFPNIFWLFFFLLPLFPRGSLHRNPPPANPAVP